MLQPNSLFYKEVNPLVIKKIFLDFYNNNLICFNAKQWDSNSRYVEITCTDHGKKVNIEKERMSACAAYKCENRDKNIVDCIIQDDGTILLELTADMLSVCGKLEIDIMVSILNVITTDDYDINRKGEITSSLISTMKFYINVISSTISYPDVEDSIEYKSLAEALTRLNALEREMADLKNQINQSITDSKLVTEEASNLLGEETDTSEADTMYGVKKATEEVIAEATILMGEENDSAEENTMYGVKKATEDIIAKATTLIGTETDTSEQDTMYGVKQAAIEAAERCNDLADEVNVSNVVGLQEALDNKSNTNHTHLYAGSEVSGGAANSAVKLETPRKVHVKIDESYTDCYFDGTEDINIGVDGILPIEHGGTGANNGAEALSNFGVTSTIEELNCCSGIKESIQEQLDNRFTKAEIIPVENGGTGATSQTEALSNILGYVPSIVKLMKVSDTTNYDDSKNTFLPLNGNEIMTDNLINDMNKNLIGETQTVSVGDRENVVTWGVLIGDNVNLVRVDGCVRYRNQGESGCNLHTYLDVLNMNDTDKIVNKNAVASNYISKDHYVTQHINTIISVKKDDFIFLQSYKGDANRNIDVLAGEYGSTYLCVEAIG